MIGLRRMRWSQLGRLGAGTVTMGLGIALLLWSRLGMAPLDILHYSVSRAFGWTFGGGIIATQAVLLMISLLLRLMPGLGTVVGFVVPAVTADVVLAVLPDAAPLAVRPVSLLVGGFLLCAGIAVYLGAGLGRLPHDGIMLAVSGNRKSMGAAPRRFALVRIAFEVTFIVIGVLLLGPADAVSSGVLGIGTLALAIGSGPVIAQLLRLQNRWFTRSRHRQVRESVDAPTDHDTADPPRGATRSEVIR